jgi:hypothetical protein
MVIVDPVDVVYIGIGAGAFALIYSLLAYLFWIRRG